MTTSTGMAELFITLIVVSRGQTLLLPVLRRRPAEEKGSGS